MKIAFLWPSYRPGRCGVSDYIAGLARELQQRNDVTCEIFDLKSDDGTWKDPREVQAWLRAADPTVLSLQFVSYAFAANGLVRKQIPYLQEALPGYPLQLMFHELWLGGARGTPLKRRVLGWFQKQGILRMLQALRPVVVHTHASVYVAMLKTAGVNALQLPLFSSVPIVDKADERTWLDGVVRQAAGLDVLREKVWLGTFFGALHPEWEPEPFFSILPRAAETARKRVCLLALGRLHRGEEKWDRLAAKYSDRFTFIKLGEQSPERVSAVLQSTDFCVAASPWLLVEKSSAVATMLDHGAPVIVTRDDYQPRSSSGAGGHDDPLLHRLDASLQQKFEKGLPRREPASRVSEVADLFLASIGRGEPNAGSAILHTASPRHGFL